MTHSSQSTNQSGPITRPSNETSEKSYECTFLEFVTRSVVRSRPYFVLLLRIRDNDEKRAEIENQSDSEGRTTKTGNDEKVVRFSIIL